MLTLKISIITVTLNPGEHDLRQTVDSVLTQDFAQWELIIKDGNSTDGSLSVLPTDSRIKLYTQKDAGIFDAMNQAMKYATGEYVCFLNAGDFFYDGQALSSVVKVLENNPNVDFIYGNIHAPQTRAGYTLYPAKLSRYYLYGHMICHQAWFVRRSYYLSAGNYETTYSSGADYRYLLKMILRDKIRYQHIPRILISYKGNGYSQNEIVRKDAEGWISALKRELYTKNEYITYDVVWSIRNIIKKTAYDHLFCKLWRVVQSWRVKP